MYNRETRKLTLRGRRWVYGIAIATLPILVAYGILTEETATLYIALIGAILVPSLAMNDVNKAEQIIVEEKQSSYEVGLDDGYQVANDEWIAANDDDRRGTETQLRKGKHGL